MKKTYCKQLVIGLPSSGKTTFIAALWHTVTNDEVPGALKLEKLHGDSKHLNAIKSAWIKCCPVDRTISSDEIVSMRLTHPDNNESELAKLLDGKNLFYIFNNSCTKEELLRKSDFIIMYNSTILIEALAYALPIFRYNGDDMKDMLVFSNNFVNFVELKDSFESLFDPITYSKVLRLHKKDYKNCFFQPSNDSVSEIYKKIIKNKTKGSHI